MRASKHRIAKLEQIAGPAGGTTPTTVFGRCPIPESDKPITKQVIDRWLKSGLAEISFGGHAILYHDGQPKMTRDEWLARTTHRRA